MIDLMTLRPFRIRRAYMRLSRRVAVPGTFFGDEILVLVEREHVHCTDAGWQLNQVGLEWWTIAMRDRLPAPTSHQSGEWFPPARELMLWTLAQGTRYQWHSGKAFRPTARKALRDLLLIEVQALDEGRDRSYRLTAEGWNYVQEWITGVGPQGE